jgi:hypothetical protein
MTFVISKHNCVISKHCAETNYYDLSAFWIMPSETVQTMCGTILNVCGQVVASDDGSDIRNECVPPT